MTEQVSAPEAPPAQADPDLVTMTITYNRKTGHTDLGGDGWDWGWQDEGTCDLMLKRARRIVELNSQAIAKAKLAEEQAKNPGIQIPDAQQQAELLKRS